MPSDILLNLHAILPYSRSNGPGVRMVIWFQGCTLACPGCFNPATHSLAPNLMLSVAELEQRVVAAATEIEGITISGGEPLLQPEGLSYLLSGVRQSTDLSVILFSGYTLEEVQQIPIGKDIVAQVDVLIGGRYEHAKRVCRGLIGSTNQTIHLLSHRYSREDLETVPPGEVFIDCKGTVRYSGILPLAHKP